jgi:hypothetical protein
MSLFGCRPAAFVVQPGMGTASRAAAVVHQSVILKFMGQLRKFLVANQYIRPKIKFCLFPLSDRPTKIAATQKSLLPRLMKNYFFKDIFFISIIHELCEYF